MLLRNNNKADSRAERNVTPLIPLLEGMKNVREMQTSQIDSGQQMTNILIKLKQTFR